MLPICGSEIVGAPEGWPCWGGAGFERINNFTVPRPDTVGLTDSTRCFVGDVVETQDALLAVQTSLPESVGSRTAVQTPLGESSFTELDTAIGAQIIGVNRPAKSSSGRNGASSPTAKRSHDAHFVCKICSRRLSGDHFYERHLQCIACQMNVNSVARTMKVPHAEAKRAYMDAITAAPLEHYANLEDHRLSLHRDAERRLGCVLANAGSCGSSCQLHRTSTDSPPSPLREAFDAVDNAQMPNKRRRRASRVKMEQMMMMDDVVENDERCENACQTGFPHPGMMLLLKACEQDLKKLERPAEVDWLPF
jgi:hypothetical protein